MGRQKNDRYVGNAANLLADFKSIQARHGDVEQDKIRMLLVEQAEDFLPIVGFDDTITGFLEKKRRELDIVYVVVCH
jgi:hypothetical protein